MQPSGRPKGGPCSALPRKWGTAPQCQQVNQYPGDFTRILGFDRTLLPDDRHVHFQTGTSARQRADHLHVKVVHARLHVQRLAGRAQAVVAGVQPPGYKVTTMIE